MSRGIEQGDIHGPEDSSFEAINPLEEVVGGPLDYTIAARKPKISRGDFLKLGVAVTGGLALRRLFPRDTTTAPQAHENKALDPTLLPEDDPQRIRETLARVNRWEILPDSLTVEEELDEQGKKLGTYQVSFHSSSVDQLLPKHNENVKEAEVRFSGLGASDATILYQAFSEPAIREALPYIGGGLGLLFGATTTAVVPRRELSQRQKFLIIAATTAGGFSAGTALLAARYSPTFPENQFKRLSAFLRRILTGMTPYGTYGDKPSPPAPTGTATATATATAITNVEPEGKVTVTPMPTSTEISADGSPTPLPVVTITPIAPTETAVPTEIPPIYTWVSFANTNVDKGSGWETSAWSDWHKTGGDVAAYEDPELGTVLKYQVNPTPPEKVRVQLDKYGEPIVGRKIRVSLPIKLGPTYGTSDWANLITLFNEDNPDVLLANIDMYDNKKLALTVYPRESNGKAVAYKSDVFLKPDKWYVLTLESIAVGGKILFKLYVDDEQVASGYSVGGNNKNQIVGLHGGAYGEGINGDSYILNGQFKVEAYS